MSEIETTFLGPTEHRGDRIKAAMGNAYVLTSYDYKLTVLENHRLAAEQAAKAFGFDPSTVKVIDGERERGFRFEVRGTGRAKK